VALKILPKLFVSLDHLILKSAHRGANGIATPVNSSRNNNCHGCIMSERFGPTFMHEFLTLAGVSSIWPP
jgi:hypothetical protein